MVHPANSTVVDYISSRADSQVAFCIILTLYLFWRCASPGRSRGLCLTGSLASLVLALLSKELAVITPLLMVLTVSFVATDRRGRYRPGKGLCVKRARGCR